jgi:hypothetical protein
MTFIGDEDCMAIYGLAKLTNEVTLKDGSIITVCTLFKSLPASPGMSRNRLFQVVDPKSSQDCVIVTYQRMDKSFIEERKFELEKELLSHLAPGQADQVFEDELAGIQFVATYHKNRGKVIRVHYPTKSHQDFVQHANNILSSPPKKKSHSAGQIKLSPGSLSNQYKSAILLIVEPSKRRPPVPALSSNQTELAPPLQRRCRRL